MRTQLPSKIETTTQAELYLFDLFHNNEAYHPEDDVADIIWATDGTAPTESEIKHMDTLMDQIYALSNFDPCEFIMDLSTEKINLK